MSDMHEKTEILEKMLEDEMYEWDEEQQASRKRTWEGYVNNL